MKSNLTKNQRNLLKLKSSKFLPSSDDMESKGVTSETHVKIIDEKSLLENYMIELLKNNDERDIKLLESTGLN